MLEKAVRTLSVHTSMSDAMLEQVVLGLKGCSTVRNESLVKIDAPKELMKLALSCGDGKFLDGLDSFCEWADSIGVDMMAKEVESWYSKDTLGNADENIMPCSWSRSRTNQRCCKCYSSIALAMRRSSMYA